MIKTILVDLGYTLAYNNKHQLYTEVLTELDYVIDVNDVDLAFHRADKHIMRFFSKLFMMKGAPYMDIYIGLVNYYLGIHENSRLYTDHYRLKVKEKGLSWQLFDGVLSVINELQSQGIKVVLVSNWDESCRKVLNHLGLDQLLDGFVISSEVNVEKPERKIFEHAIKIAECSKEECLFVGDNYYDDAVGSKAFGLPYVIINRYETVGMEEIKEQTIRSFAELPSYIRGLKHV